MRNVVKGFGGSRCPVVPCRALGSRMVFRPLRVSCMHPFVVVPFRGSVSWFRFVVPFRGFVSSFRFVVPFRGFDSWFRFMVYDVDDTKNKMILKTKKIKNKAYSY